MYFNVFWVLTFYILDNINCRSTQYVFASQSIGFMYGPLELDTGAFRLDMKRRGSREFFLFFAVKTTNSSSFLSVKMQCQAAKAARLIILLI